MPFVLLFGTEKENLQVEKNTVLQCFENANHLRDLNLKVSVPCYESKDEKPFGS